MEAEEGIDYRDPGGEKFASARLAPLAYPLPGDMRRRALRRRPPQRRAAGLQRQRAE